MKEQLTPFTGGIDRSANDMAQSRGGLRDAIGVQFKQKGAMDGLYQGPSVANFQADYTPTRWTQWGGRAVLLDSNPSNTVAIQNGNTYVSGPTGNGRSAGYDSALAVAIEDAQAQILVDSSVTDPFSNASCYVSTTTIEGEISTITGSGSVTINFKTGGGDLRPFCPAGTEPLYVLFKTDANRNATTARIRPVTSFTPDPVSASGDYITQVVYTGDIPAGVATDSVARLIVGTSSTDTFKPDGFFVYRDRLGAWKGNTVYFSGYPGNPSPFYEPNIYDFTYWWGFNIVNVGNASDGDIVRCIPTQDAIIVFLSGSVHRISGYPPIDGSIDNQLVIKELAANVGCVGFDGATQSNDGQAAYFIGSDQNFYVAGPGGIEEISQPVRWHERNEGMTHVAATENSLAVGGSACDATKVPSNNSEDYSGLLSQYPATFLYNLENAAWSNFVRLGTDSQGSLVPFTDPNQHGAIGVFEKNGRRYYAFGSNGTIHVLNDPDVNTYGVDDGHIAGFVTHELQYAGATQKRIDSISVQCRNVKSRTLSAVMPAISPQGVVQTDVTRSTPQKSIGNSAIYGLFSRDTKSVAGVSVGVGYTGEYLLAGVSEYPPVMNTRTLSGSGMMEQFALTGRTVSRVDVLCDNVTDLTLKVWADSSGSPDLTDLLFSRSLTTPKSGHASGSRFWRSFDMRFPLDAGTYWFEVNGTADCYTYATGKTVLDQAGSSLYTAQSIVYRLVYELGAPFVADRIEQVTLDYKKVGAVEW